MGTVVRIVRNSIFDALTVRIMSRIDNAEGVATPFARSQTHHAKKEAHRSIHSGAIGW